MIHPLRGKTAIAGSATAGMGEAPGWSATELMCEAAVKAVADAGLSLPDIDGIFATTSTHAFPTLSGRFVGGGAIAPGGQMAVNTNGGGLSCVHPGMYGMFLIVEAVTQLRGTAGERQLPRCDVALCHGNGGTLSSQVTALLGNAATV